MEPVRLAHVLWPIVALILGTYALTIWALYLRDVRERTLDVERQLASMREHAEKEFVAAKQALLNIAGGLESRIRDLEMKVN